MTTPAHNVQLSWQITDLGEVAEQPQVDVSPDGKSVSVRMTCPRCEGTTTTTHRRGFAGTKGMFKKRREEKREERLKQEALAQTRFCECGYRHANRPDGTYLEGCGAQWQLPAPSGGTL
jgi:hypothetical protein